MITAMALTLASCISVASQSSPTLLDRIREAAPQRLEGSPVVHFSAGAETRAQALQGMLAQASAFFRDQFSVTPTFTLAVLDPVAWKAAVGESLPYGMPAVTQRVMLLPYRQEGVVVDTMLARADGLPDEVATAVKISKRPFASHVAAMVDLIGYHELGHLYVSELGIAPHTRWFSEMLATYFAYAFIAERSPDLAATWRIAVGADANTTPTHRSLADFERLYAGVGPANYVWYQGRFTERVIAIYATQRLQFLRAVKGAFPREAKEKLTLDQVLDRLETIEPGFKAWADSLATLKP
jgi:hypothetical protein